MYFHLLMYCIVQYRQHTLSILLRMYIIHNYNYFNNVFVIIDNYQGSK